MRGPAGRRASPSPPPQPRAAGESATPPPRTRAAAQGGPATALRQGSRTPPPPRGPDARRASAPGQASPRRPSEPRKRSAAQGSPRHSPLPPAPADGWRFLVGNEHELGPKSAPDHPQLRGDHRHRVVVFLRAAPGQAADPLRHVLRVRFRGHQTLTGVSELALSQPPFERRMLLWGYFDVCITVEFKRGAADPVDFVHTISFDGPLTQTEHVVHRRAAATAPDSTAASLIDAVKLGDVAQVRRAAAAAAPAAVDQAAMLALAEHRLDALRALLPRCGEEPGAPAAERERGLAAALFRACRTGDAAGVGAALKAGAQVLSKDESGRQAQHIAAQEGTTAALEALRRVPGGITAARDAEGRNVLHCAAERGHVAAMAALLSWPDCIPSSLLDERSHGGPYGPGLTPKLIALYATELYYPQRLEAARDFFAAREIDWGDHVQPVLSDAGLSAPQRAERLAALEGAGPPGRRLRWYNYCVARISEGRGVIDWHSARVALILGSLVLPLLQGAARGAINNDCRQFLRHLLTELRGVSAAVPDPGGAGQSVSSGDAVRQRAAELQNEAEQALHEAQKALQELPTATQGVLERGSLPPGWPEVPHQMLAHEELPWLSSGTLGAPEVYRSLLRAGAVGDPGGFLRWFDESVVPVVDWPRAADPALRGGTAGQARCSEAALQTLAAAMRLSAYDSLLLAWAAQRDPPFQSALAQWAVGRGWGGRLRAGPLKRAERVRVKKLDYMRLPSVDAAAPPAPPPTPPPAAAGGGAGPRHSPEEILAMADSKLGNPPGGNAAAAGRICDLSRAALACESEGELLGALGAMRAWRLETDGLQVLRIKNLHHASVSPGDLNGGYRDVKCLVLHEAKGGERFVHEVQLILSTWLAGKRAMHILYDATR